MAFGFGMGMPLRGMSGLSVTPPTITSSSTFDVNEDTTPVGTLTATGDAPITWSITGGADSAKFTINSGTGALAFAAAPDYENPQDADTNNVYVVQVTATNSVGSANQTINVTVVDVAYTTSASDYDGTNDYATRGGVLTGIVDGKEGTLSVWLRIDGGNGSVRAVLSSVSFKIELALLSTNVFRLTGRNSVPLTILQVDTATARTAGATWLHMLFSWNLATPVVHAYVNDVSDKAGGSTETNDTIDYNMASPNYSIGGRTDGSLKWNGCLSEIFFHTTYLDISQQSNRRKFISATGKPVDIGANGALALGVQPLLYAKNGNPSTNSGTGGNFTITGALDACSSSPSD